MVIDEYEVGRVVEDRNLTFYIFLTVLIDDLLRRTGHWLSCDGVGDLLRKPHRIRCRVGNRGSSAE